MARAVRAPAVFTDTDASTSTKTVPLPAAGAGHRLVIFTAAPAVVTGPVGWTKGAAVSLNAYEIAYFHKVAAGGETSAVFTLSGPRGFAAVTYEHAGLGAPLYAAHTDSPAAGSPTLPALTLSGGDDVVAFAMVAVDATGGLHDLGAWDSGYTRTGAGGVRPASTENFQVDAAMKDGLGPGSMGAALHPGSAVTWQALHVAFTDSDGLPSIWSGGRAGEALCSRSPHRAGRTPLRSPSRR